MACSVRRHPQIIPVVGPFSGEAFAEPLPEVAQIAAIARRARAEYHVNLGPNCPAHRGRFRTVEVLQTRAAAEAAAGEVIGEGCNGGAWETSQSRAFRNDSEKVAAQEVWFPGLSIMQRCRRR